jgi:hypothetical protein
MRAPLATLCLVLMWNAPFAADESDPYSVAVVRSLLSLPPGASFGVSEKQNERLGDRAAIATLKLFDEADLTRPETIRKLLPVLRDSFSYPQLISIAEDRRPAVTLFLLHYLERNAPDPALKKEITAVEVFIKAKTEGKAQQQ